PLLPIKPPTHGFHLVDLHAVVRNSVEWRTWLPKVEPVFRVGDNRDTVLLGLVHALGGRLSCSSKHDIKAGTYATRSVSRSPQASVTTPLRLFDRHICRPPALLRAAAMAGVSLYEVDCVDELCRIAKARHRTSISATRPSTTAVSSIDAIPRKEEVSKVAAQRPPVEHRATGATPGSGSGVYDVAEALIRLTVPPRIPRVQVPGVTSCQPSSLQDKTLSTPLETNFGASFDGVVEIVQRVAATMATKPSAVQGTASRGGESGRHCRGDAIDDGACRTRGGAQCRPWASFFPSIVGFSIDVGQVCLDDAIAAEAALEVTT
ncbi:unnamed protein product, partial [Sphacelaria rigidula]